MPDERHAGRTHRLGSDRVHYCWNNSLESVLRVESGDTVLLHTRDGAEGFFTADSRHEDATRRPFNGHCLTGPIWIESARPGDTLQVDILDLTPGPLGYTAILPGKGLLPNDFTEPYLKVWDLTNGRTAQFKPGIEVPLEPFQGVMGVALAEPGRFSTAPPRHVGGNLDVKQLTKGTTLLLPIEVDGALFSVGDGHAAQGDGEVCINAIETSMTTSLRFTLRRDLRIGGPRLRTSGPIARATNTAGWEATMATGPDLHETTRDAVRGMIELLGQEYGLSREEAFVLCSVAVDLKISEVVNAPNWVVSAFLPLSLFQS
ncbi:MAG: acetamidase/formamidase family protein [Chloroflexi bacterium]|nr:acetamidase/formamidase family protein [Chloroflexota bacterium]